MHEGRDFELTSVRCKLYLFITVQKCASWYAMKISRTEAFMRYAQFARDVAELARSNAARARWLAIAEFWKLHSNGRERYQEQSAPLSAEQHRVPK
jgi:hypothetical protein